MKKLEEIKNLASNAENNLFIAEKNIEKLKKRIEILEKEQKQESWPKVGDSYYCYNELGVISQSIHRDDTVVRFKKVTNNCHRTKEQALRHKEYITSPRVRARELVEMCEGFDPLAEEAMVQDGGYVGGFTFVTEKFAKLAIDKLGKPLIKVALGVITGEEAERIVREYVGRDD